MTKHFVDWTGLDFKEKESQYEKYHKRPDHFKESFVGPATLGVVLDVVQDASLGKKLKKNHKMA